jgi:peptidoglycan/LPS O-acetylase OafA/YrhL
VCPEGSAGRLSTAAELLISARMSDPGEGEMISGRELSHRIFQVDSLDGLRGLAVFMVFLSHTSNNDIPLFPFIDLSGIGKGGVFLFFTLSAFLLTYPFIALVEKAFSIRALANYFLRRFLRIYPLLLLYLLLALGTTQLFSALHLFPKTGIPFSLTPAGFLRSLFQLEGRGVTWSILVEFKYYFLLPVMAVLFGVVFRRRVLPALASTVALIILSLLLWPPNRAVNNDSSLGVYLPVFLIGSFLAVLHFHWNQPGSRWKNRAVETTIEILGFAGVLGFIALIPSVAHVLFWPKATVETVHHQFLLFGIFCAFLLFACLNGRGGMRGVFEFRPLRYLGFTSYSVYLIHPMMIHIYLRTNLNLPLAGWWTLAATLALSFLTFHFIEKPFSKIRLPTGE